jgi:hypothetical protein
MFPKIAVAPGRTGDEQLAMAAHLGDPAVLDHDDAIEVGDGRKTVATTRAVESAISRHSASWTKRSDSESSELVAPSSIRL